MAKRITEFTSATSLAEADVLPIVDVSDTTQATSGTTKKSALSLIADYLKARVETLTNKTLTSPKINEDVVLTATSTELNKITGMLDWFYPVGTIYETTSTDLDTTTKMATHFGGTWEAFASGRVLVGKASSGTFATAGATGGAETHTLSEKEMPEHVHGLGAYGDPGLNGAHYYKTTRVTNQFGTGSTLSAGSGNAHNNLQPYIVVYRYRRVS